MLRKLQGVIESLLTYQYRNIARDMHAESAMWQTVEIVGTPASIRTIVLALERVQDNVKYARLIETNLKAIVSIEGALTNTFPVAKVYVIDTIAVARTDHEGVAALLVQAAAYIEFYKARSVFLPKFFQKRTDAEARAEARRVALEFQGA
jgi:3-phosphoglycerate kinase